MIIFGLLFILASYYWIRRWQHIERLKPEHTLVMMSASAMSFFFGLFFIWEGIMDAV